MSKAPIKIQHEDETHCALLRIAFDQICDKTNWKLPVNAIVPWTCASLYYEAIVFMTGSVPSSNRTPEGGCHLQAEGYYAAVGA